MARTDNFANFATDVANSIREMTGKTDKIPASQFDVEIKSISTGSGEEVVLQDKTVTVTSNGRQTVTADDGYTALNSVDIITNVSGDLPSKYITVTQWQKSGHPIKYSIKGVSNLPQYYFYKNPFVQEVDIQDTMSIINSYCFQDCTNLEHIYLPNTIGFFGQSCFQGCSKLKLEELPPNLDPYMNENTIFSECSSITIKKIPDSVTYISGNGIFRNCSSMTQISMKNVTGIGGGSEYWGDFSYTGLRAAWIGSAITNSSFGRYAFSGCDDLKKMFIDLPRATVEGMTGYSNKWGATYATVICNDDSDFVTKDVFDATDWLSVIG